MSIDAHHHVWHYTPQEYDWIDDRMQAIRRNFLPLDLEHVASPLGVRGAVTVQARQSLEETRWLLRLAAENSFIRGVVGWVPLASPGVGDTLDSLTSKPLLKGVRHVVQGESDPEFLSRPAFNDGLRHVERCGLVYDILILQHQLPQATLLVDRHPSLTFVLDHIAKPVVQGTPDPIWAGQLRNLAARPNVYCKFSGVVTEVPGWQWTAADLQPYFDVALSAFGPRRLMFGSDWPVCLVASGYERWYRCVETLASGLSSDESVRLFGGTAREAYKLSH